MHRILWSFSLLLFLKTTTVLLDENSNRFTNGTDFVIGFMDGDQTYINAQLAFLNSPENKAASTVTVTSPHEGYSSDPITVNGYELLSLPSALLHFGSERSTKGIRVTSDLPVSVYGINGYGTSVDTFLAFPNTGLNKEYMVITYSVNKLNTEGGSQFLVIGVEDDTSVQVTVTGSVTYQGTPYSAGSSFCLTLDALDSVQFQSQDDLTGSKVSSSEIVSVFSGNRCDNVPGSVSWFRCSQMVSQVPPLNLWGDTYITTPLATRTAGDIFRVLAAENETAVQISGQSAPVILHSGQFREYDVPSTESWLISADAPILVAQFSKGFTADSVTGDPFMMIIPSLDDFVTGRFGLVTLDIFSVTTEKYHINIVVDCSVKTQLTSSPNISVTWLNTTQHLDLCIGTAELGAGSYLLGFPKEVEFQVLVYAFAPNTGYGYPGLEFGGDSENDDLSFTYCPSDIEVDNDAGSGGVVVTWNHPVATEFNNCQRTVLSIASLSNHSSGDFFGVGTTSVNYHAIDSSLNEIHCSFKITVNDVFFGKATTQAIADSQSCVIHSTDRTYYYRYFDQPILGTEMAFEVKANNDVHIALTAQPQDSAAMYEIVIGGWSNSRSVIRRSKQGTNYATVPTVGIVSPSEFRSFWISWENGLIKVGKLGEAAFMSWQDPNPLEVNYYGYSTGWGSKGEFIFCSAAYSIYPETDINEKLSKLLEVKVTKENVKSVSTNVTLITSEPQSLTAGDFTAVTDLLERITAVNTIDEAQDVVKIVDNLMQVDDDIIQQSQVGTKIVSILETYIQKVSLGPAANDSFRDVGYSIGLETWTADLNDIFSSSYGLSYASFASSNDHYNCDNLTTYNISGYSNYQIPVDQIDVSIHLPNEVFNHSSAADGVESNRVSFIIYQDDVLFTSPSLGENSTTNDYFVNTRVIAGLVGGKPIQNLSSPLTLNFYIQNETFKNHAKCVFWDFEVSGWSSNGCQLKGMEKGRVTCECNHLTNFAVLMSFSQSTPAIHDTILTIISKIGIGISIVALFITILSFFF